MKTLSSMFLATFLCIALIGCSKSDAPSAPATEAPAAKNAAPAADDAAPAAKESAPAEGDAAKEDDK